jgi:pimeloyl-ACP methyl ester carboxylesterase
MKVDVNLKVLLSVLILAVIGCNKSEDEIIIENDNLIEAINVKSYNSSELISTFNSLGTLYPLAEGFSSNVSSGVDVYRIKYKTSFKGNVIYASGLICIPDESGTYPILSFQNGTNTSNDKAPSNNLDDVNFRFLHGISGMGYVVVIPDYIGFGESSHIVHPYLHAESTVDAVVDLIHTAKEFADDEDIEITLNDKLFLMGYSQGGWATMNVHKALEANPGESLTVTASSCGAGSYDMNIVKDYIFSQTTYPQPYYLAYVAYAYQSMGIISEQLSTIFNEPYASEIPSLFNGSFTNSEVNEELEQEVELFLTENILNNFETDNTFSDFRDALIDNSVTAWRPAAPIKLYHGTVDDFVPYIASESIYNEFMDLGVSTSKVELIPLEETNHYSALIPMGIGTIEWFNSFK